MAMSKIFSAESSVCKVFIIFYKYSNFTLKFKSDKGIKNESNDHKMIAKTNSRLVFLWELSKTKNREWSN